MNGEDTQQKAGALFVGLDVHKDSIAACGFNASTGEIVLERQLKNQPAAVARLIKRIRTQHSEPRCCYEASSSGFVLFRQLDSLGVI